MITIRVEAYDIDTACGEHGQAPGGQPQTRDDARARGQTTVS
jgi:hypothetical protein